MPGYVPSFNTIYEKPVALPPKVGYGRNVALLGLANSGPFSNPVYAGTTLEARNAFVSGPLVDAYEEVYETGCRTIYLVRLVDLARQSFLDAFEILADYEIHIVVPIGVYFDDIGDYGQLLVDFCSMKKAYGESIAVMAVKPFDPNIILTAQDLDDRVTELYQSAIARKSFGDEGYFLSVVTGEFLLFEGEERTRFSPGATSYAGLLSLVRPGQSPVNKKIRSVSKLRYTLFSTTRTENVILGIAPVILQRRPYEGTVKVATTEMTPVDCMEYRDFIVDYNLGTIVAKDMSGPVTVTYRYDDYDSLASVGYAPLMNFVKNGAAIGASVTMSKNSISLVQDIRVMQSIAAHIREVGSDFIGNSNISLDYFDSYIDEYLTSLFETHQIADGEHVLLRTSGGKDLQIEITIQPRDSVRAQTFRLELPSPSA